MFYITSRVLMTEQTITLQECNLGNVIGMFRTTAAQCLVVFNNVLNVRNI